MCYTSSPTAFTSLSFMYHAFSLKHAACANQVSNRWFGECEMKRTFEQKAERGVVYTLPPRAFRVWSVTIWSESAMCRARPLLIALTHISVACPPCDLPLANPITSPCALDPDRGNCTEKHGGLCGTTSLSACCWNSDLLFFFFSFTNSCCFV